jgi:hypothetical protein
MGRRLSVILGTGLAAVLLYRRREELASKLVELWASVADVLGPYQDRVADESYLGTAEKRRSIAEALNPPGCRTSALDEKRRFAWKAAAC